MNERNESLVRNGTGGPYDGPLDIPVPYSISIHTYGSLVLQQWLSYSMLVQTPRAIMVDCLFRSDIFYRTTGTEREGWDVGRGVYSKIGSSI